jgi:hypothetical protein
MIRTVSLWIRINGKFSQPLYQDNKQTRLKLPDGEYYLRVWVSISTSTSRIGPLAQQTRH